MFLFTRLLCETQESLSQVGHLASLEALGTPPSLPDSMNNLVSAGTPTEQSSRFAPLTILPPNVLPVTDLSLINATNLRQQQAPTGKQPSLLTDSRQANCSIPLSTVSIIKNMTLVVS
jgi:hypothetical protein